MNRFQNALFASLRPYLAGGEPAHSHTFAQDSTTGFAGLGNQLRQGLQGRTYEFDQVQEEVATEQRGQIWLAGRHADDLHTLLAQLWLRPVAKRYYRHHTAGGVGPLSGLSTYG